ncbi:MAG: molybdopterin biosynthesis protein [Armatimonadetes bacterium CG2_30_59_28]|nr:molybdopterin biosynthesis protein [Armatimonadota bacterium]OIO96888.1 MAG: molybdopterin biosynthesis protein [Armatimonadetes bacterium CG2_30_59_28]PIU62099.1 MAG: molybdopterin biosynthesis protein [Armatimonadetes bacterium CG07_land_8_20_14_0_80_59_28]PIX41280.1 MAG: molybdopterin biosynthesis protein [Armatimonadetes bacterium CG_4_8_14_3_um_filter_58_9]
MHKFEFRETLTLEEAQARWKLAVKRRGDIRTPAESVPVEESLGRVTAAAVRALLSSPHYHAAAMDGIAVVAASTFGAVESSPTRLAIGSEAVFVNTGDPIPERFDAVIKIEEVRQLGPTDVDVYAPVGPWNYVRIVGENVVATEMILPEGHPIRPVDIGAVLSAGVIEIPVRAQPRAVIIPTGSEVVEPGTELKPGDVIEFNSRIVGASLRDLGADFVRHPVVRDDTTAIRDAVQRCSRDYDVLILLAGASGTGSRDFTPAALKEIGEVIVHGVALRPGKPVLLAMVDGRPLVNLPGYPVSTIINFDLFVRPVICGMLGRPVPDRQKVAASVSAKVPSPMGTEDFVHVRMGRIGGRYLASPARSGASTIVAAAHSDGFFRIPAKSEGVLEHEEVQVELLRDLSDIDNALLVIGSHDMCLDLLTSVLRNRDSLLRISSSHVGSYAGLAALGRKECHASGCHLLDSETGEYNVPFVRQLVAGKRVTLVTVSFREQGLIVAPGNPKALSSISSLAREGVIFVNRQRGSGTRILLDYELRREGLGPRSINGYSREAYTHLAAAAAVAAGSADAALGIRAAATAMGMDFVMVAREQYELAILSSDLNDPRMEQLLDAIRSPQFRSELSSLGGYDVSRTGEIREVEA